MTDIDAETQALQDWGEEGRATQRAIDDALATTRAELAAKDAALREALDLMRGEPDMSLRGSDHWVWAEKVRELIGDGETA